MRSVYLLTIALSLIGSKALAQESYTLEKCVEYALENNQSARSAQLEKQIAETQIAETRGMGLPSVNASGDFTYNPAVQQQVLPNFLAPAVYQVLAQEQLVNPQDIPQDVGVTPVAFGTDYTSTVTLNVNQLVFDGSYFVGLQAARTLRELTVKQALQTEIQVVENVSKAYYLALINRDRIDLLEANLSRLDTLLYETNALYENGFAEEIDVDRIKVNYNNLKTEYQNLQKSQEITHYALKLQMGMPIQENIQIEGRIGDYTVQPEEVMGKDYTYQDRIEFRQLQTNLELKELDKKNNQVGYLPKFYAFGRFGYNTGTNAFDELSNFNDNWFGFAAIGLNLNWSLFDGLQRHYRIQRNKLEMQQIMDQRKNLKNSIDLEVSRARVNLQNALNSLEAQEENRELAQRVYKTTKLKFEEGLGSNLEVVEADASLKEAQTNYYDALYNALIARIDLEKALGILHQ